jgi:hypothetical protein
MGQRVFTHKYGGNPQHNLIHGKTEKKDFFDPPKKRFRLLSFFSKPFEIFLICEF